MAATHRPRRLLIRRSVALAAACFAASAGTMGEPSARAAPAPAAKTLDYSRAQHFVLSLINRDRESAGLSPVVLDEDAANAGLRHARDMAASGFTGHVGSDGSVPEQRYTASGGNHFVQENAACLSDGVKRKLDERPRFEAVKLAALHDMFMAERPPNDGHRRNILNPLHNRVGVGLAQSADVRQPCLAQEFVDKYGEYEALPRETKRGAKLHVAGTVSKPLVFGGVGIGRIPPREPSSGGPYRIPAPDTMYFSARFKTPKPVKVDGPHFSIDLDLEKAVPSGNYALSIWAKRPDSKELFMISMRTITVR